RDHARRLARPFHPLLAPPLQGEEASPVPDLSPRAFTPPPKVDSSVLVFEACDMDIGLISSLEKVTAAAFGQRRKMLRQSLKNLPGALESLNTLGIDETRRAETLSVDEYVDLARAIGATAR
ncbi:rRNA adenine N-6-methyltransferase family protein, partial [Thalassobaculum salexigens]|uniref:rRNA adenine N-6-methyltransferase family protein n=1 Tax=Thalassobaculum salexigens TaxID=455360 RepID=UPI00248F1A64